MDVLDLTGNVAAAAGGNRRFIKGPAVALDPAATPFMTGARLVVDGAVSFA